MKPEWKRGKECSDRFWVWVVKILKPRDMALLGFSTEQSYSISIEVHAFTFTYFPNLNGGVKYNVWTNDIIKNNTSIIKSGTSILNSNSNG